MAIKYATTREELNSLLVVRSFDERVTDAMEFLPYLSKSGATVLTAMMVSIEAYGGKPIFRNVAIETDNASSTRIELHIQGDIDSDVQDDVNYFANVIRSILVVK